MFVSEGFNKAVQSNCQEDLPNESEWAPTVRGESRDSVSFATVGQPSAHRQPSRVVGGSTTNLRSARCIGALSDVALEDPETLREVFIEWGTVLEDLTVTVGQIVQTLLTAEGRLSQRELADRADILTRTIRNYRN